LNKFHSESTGAEITPKLLAKQHFDVGLVINHKDQEVHADAPLFVVWNLGRLQQSGCDGGH
jgi:hypothetical protein